MDNLICIKAMYGAWHVWTTSTAHLEDDEWPEGQNHRRFKTKADAKYYARQLKGINSSFLEILELV